MNDQANEVLANMMQRALDGVDASVEFSQAQIPEVVEQLLMWHMVESMVIFSTTLMVASALWIFSIEGIVRMEGVKSRDNDGCAPYIQNEWFDRYGGPTSKTVFRVFIPVGLSFISTLVFLIESNLDWLKIMIAPKLYLLEYAARLVG